MSSSKPPNSSAPAPSTSLKRKSNSLVEPNRVVLTPRQSLATQTQHGQARTFTPYRPGSAQCTKESSANTVSATRASNASRLNTTDPTFSRTATTSLATATAPKQYEMDRFLESEMHGAIFCDPNFVENFLTVDATRLQSVLEACEEDLDALRFQDHITREHQLYEPIRRVLNHIKQAVDHVPDPDQLDGFVDVSAEAIQSHCDDIVGIKPDLALFDGPTRHWETVRTVVEVKRQATYLKTGMKQLTRYARAVFAHQLHRRHLYGLAICKWEATFVRFDRSGILYSKPIDIRGEAFRKAFAGLMMLGEEA
ncbi:hypothetical protein FRC08_012757, partial [Ceratobasidium sp. 394]